MTLRIIDTGINSAEKIMALDADFLETLDPQGSAILHLYEWAQDSATFGCFTRPDDFINLESAREKNLALAKRPTGGGIVFHITDFAFSMLIPSSHPKFSINTLENYALINNCVIDTVQKLRNPTSEKPTLLPIEPIGLDKACSKFCMAKPTKYDVIIDGKKIGGSAQRRTKNGFLHQGTISVATLTRDYLEQVLHPGNLVIEAMLQNSASLLSAGWSQKDLQEMRKQVYQNLIHSTQTLI